MKLMDLSSQMLCKLSDSFHKFYTFSCHSERNGTRFEVMREGSALLEVRGFDPDWLFYDWIGIAMYSVIFTTLAYIALRLIKKEK